jgi:hypothetical protein
VRLTQHVAPAPRRFDVVLAVRRAGELLAQLTDEDVDNLDLRLVHATVELGEASPQLRIAADALRQRGNRYRWLWGAGDECEGGWAGRAACNDVRPTRLHQHFD